MKWEYGTHDKTCQSCGKFTFSCHCSADRQLLIDFAGWIVQKLYDGSVYDRCFDPGRLVDKFIEEKGI